MNHWELKLVKKIGYSYQRKTKMIKVDEVCFLTLVQIAFDAVIGSETIRLQKDQ